MRVAFKHLVLILLDVTLTVEASTDPGSRYATVRVEQGTLRGLQLLSAAGVGGSYFSFRGIPYAAPPLGRLRFVDAQPPKPWYGLRDAIEESSACTQRDEETSTYIGAEDCLYLNVYTPYLHTHGDRKKKLPVMFWIHGGGFVFGTGASQIYGPDYLVSEGIVLVTINYRLGPFGFLRMKQAAPGNAGIKDQVAALRWVKRNVEAFGGDSDKITIFGESAGGASVHLHMLSPMSKGLFHGALAQSGAGINPWAFQRSPEEKARRLGSALGCEQDEPLALVDCLRGADSLAVIKAAHERVPTHADEERLLNFVFVPCLEYTVPGVEKFLPGLPEDLTGEGLINHVPYMTGVASQEGLLIWAFNLGIDFHNQTVLTELDSKWNENVWPEVRASPNSTKRESALAAIRQFYLGGNPLTVKQLQKYFDLYSDLEFSEGVAFTLRCMSKYLNAPLYQYVCNIDDELNFLKFTFNISWPGTSHADELGYLFHTERLPKVMEDSTAGLARRRMVRLWANFAKYGNPTPKDDALLGVAWKQYTEEERNYLEIATNLSAKVDLYRNRFKFWEEFYSTYA